MFFTAVLLLSLIGLYLYVWLNQAVEKRVDIIQVLLEPCPQPVVVPQPPPAILPSCSDRISDGPSDNDACSDQNKHRERNEPMFKTTLTFSVRVPKSIVFTVVTFQNRSKMLKAWSVLKWQVGISALAGTTQTPEERIDRDTDVIITCDRFAARNLKLGAHAVRGPGSLSFSDDSRDLQLLEFGEDQLLWFIKI